MNTQMALEQLGVTENDITEAQRHALDEQGYFVIENGISPEDCAAMNAEIDRLAALEGDKAGSEVSQEAGSLRISNIFNKTTAFDPVLSNKPFLAASRHMLGEFKLHGSNVREPRKGRGKQPLHADTVKKEDGRWCLINALFCFDALTLENGPTRIVPGSHKWAPLNVPGENAADYSTPIRTETHKWALEGDNLAERTTVSPVLGDTSHFPEDPFAAYPGEVHVTVPAGAIVVCNAHMWHSGTEKRDDSRRRMLHLTYIRRDMPQQLVQRNYVTPELMARLSPAQRYLFELDEA